VVKILQLNGGPSHGTTGTMVNLALTITLQITKHKTASYNKSAKLSVTALAALLACVRVSECTEFNRDWETHM